jgi:tRNA U34 5-methylaminomethyl-2-thiouridine-forming methyltransferase MnmC
VLAIALMMMASVSIHAQQPTQEDILNNVAKLKRIEAMQPDSIQPKYQLALQSLSFAITYTHALQTENMIAEAEQAITKMEQMKHADQSDVCTLRGFLYMVRIVQNPAQNGQRYYLDVMQNYEKALKLNPDNQLAKQLQQKFFEGMKQQTGK